MPPGWDVDAHHYNMHGFTVCPRYPAVASEDRRFVAIGVPVDEVQCLVEPADPDDREDRAEDLVDEKGGPEPEASRFTVD